MRNSPNFSLADEVIVRALEAGAFPSACLLVGRDERVLYRRAYGRLSIEDDAPLTNEHTRYDLASVTKPLVVGMLTLRAMEAANCACGTGWARFWMRRRTSATSPLPRS